MTEKESEDTPRSMTLAEILGSNEVVHVVDGPLPHAAGQAIIVAPKGSVQLADPSDVDIREIGHTGMSPFTGWLHREYNPLLRNQSGLRIYNEMRRADGTVRGSLRLMKTPILAARWFMEPASDSKRDQNVADFVWWNLTKGMSTSFPQFITEALLMLDFGFYMFEKVFTLNDQRPQAKGKVTWKKLAPRHPLDLTEWLFDENGGPSGARVFNSQLGSDVAIPIDKLLIFTFDLEAGDLSGISVLRSAYKPWYFKQQLEKIDAIQKERHGIGVPVIKLPPNFSKDDLALAQNMGRNIRTNEMAHIVLPPNWEVMFAKLEGQPVDALKSIDYHNGEIHKNILAAFMDRSAPTKDDDFTMFMKSTRYVADIVADIINKHLIPQLVDFNWSRLPNGYPQLRARRIGEYADWRAQSFAIRNLVGSNIIRPDDRLEDQLRVEMDLPAVDEDTIRETQTPQAPGGQQQGGRNSGGNQDGQQPMAGQQIMVPGQPPRVQPPGPARVGPPRQRAQPVVAPPAAPAGRDASGGR